MSDQRFAARPRPQYKQRRFARPGSEDFSRTGPRTRPNKITPSTNVFVNYIPPDFTEADLRALCSEYGTIVASKIMINLETGESRCFGFVRFETLEQAEKAIKGLDGREIGNKWLLAKYAESHEKKEKASNTVYVKRLPMSVTVEDVYRMFSQFGRIVDTIPHWMENIDPQYWRCFVKFNTFQEATAAISAMNNQIVAPNTRPIHARFADESRMSQSFTNGAPMVTRNSYQAQGGMPLPDPRFTPMMPMRQHSAAVFDLHSQLPDTGFLDASQLLPSFLRD